MAEHGIQAHILCRDVAGGGGGRVVDSHDEELNLLLINAFDDDVTALASAAPNRLIPLMGKRLSEPDFSHPTSMSPGPAQQRSQGC